MKIFEKVLFATALVIGLACATSVLSGCGSEDNPNPGDDAGTNDTDGNGGGDDGGTTDAGVRCGDTKCEGDENCESCPSDCGCASGTVCQAGACVNDAFAEVKVVVPGEYLQIGMSQPDTGEVNRYPAKDYGCNGIMLTGLATALCVEIDLSLSLCKDGESTGPLCATNLKNVQIKTGQISADCSVLAQFGQEVKNWCEALPAKAKCSAPGECGVGGVMVEYTLLRLNPEETIDRVFKKI